MNQNTAYVVPSSFVEQLKQKARKLKRVHSMTHTEALESVAREAGFNHWKHVTESAASTAPTERAYLDGLIVAYDLADAFEGIGSPLVADPMARYFCERELQQVIPEWLEPEEGERPYKVVYAGELESVICEVLDELAFYRFVGSPIPSTVDDAISANGPCSFWPPLHMWLSGQYYDLSNELAKDGNGNIVGVRF